MSDPQVLDPDHRPDFLTRTVALLSGALLWVAGAAIIVLMLHICADVAGKYFFNQPIVGTLEIVSRYYMVACVFLPLAFVQLHRKHLVVEMFTMGLSARRRAALDAGVALLGLAYVTLLTWLVFGRAVAATRDNEFLSLTFYDLPAWPARWLLPISFGLFALILLAQFIDDVRFAVTGSGRPATGSDDGVGVME